MKTLIINGSPRSKGDTAALLAVLRGELRHDITELNAYHAHISPCTDCRYCWHKQGCRFQDDMELVYAGNYDGVVVASPVYMGTLTGPMVSLASRLQPYYAARRFQKNPIAVTSKKGAVILVGGGDGAPGHALELAGFMLKTLGARLLPKHVIQSLRTDSLPARDDPQALAAIRRTAAYLNGPPLSQEP